ncbi:MAG TPA: hypothetical protein PKD64_04865 [Pirellulaceae bacterium]|nr:hypothetical protein [Pirellulaceae bacterium]HMO91506.1 hypothetical protein [Pirellulaceae bacterium]HMP70979.1 hypothetical protein [Pirellulaceae bacterium]
MRSIILAQLVLLAVWGCELRHLGAQSTSLCLPQHDVAPPSSYLRLVQNESVCVRPGDDVWWISSRNLHTELVSPNQLIAFRYAALDGEQVHWQLAQANDFVIDHNDNSDRQTVFYVHGNRTNVEWSMRRGVQVYQGLYGNRDDAPPVRFVIWHWPADENYLRIQEYEDNAMRAIIHGRHFSRFMHFLNPNHSFSFIGFSLGFQFVMSAAEQTAKFAGERNEQSQAWCERGVHVVALAPVVANDWSIQEGRIERASQLVNKVIAFDNRSDLALKAFKLKSVADHYKCIDSSKIISILAQGGTTSEQIDVAEWIGRAHEIKKYVTSDVVSALIFESLDLGSPKEQPSSMK